MTTTIAIIITVVTCCCSVIITALLMTGTVFGGNMKKNVYRWFFIALLFNAIGSCVEGVAVMLIGLPEKPLAKYLVYWIFSAMFSAV